MINKVAAAFAAVWFFAASPSVYAQDLPSWNDGEAKSAILDFVDSVTTEGTATFVPEDERIAVFDNDGTLWIEQPVYTQLRFVLDRISDLAADNPDWATTEPYASAINGDLDGIVAGGLKAVVELTMASHAGMTTDEFTKIAEDWINTAKHPRFDRSYTELVYQPMLELLDLLRDRGFKTFIVSGGGQSFMRPWTMEVYGIPPEQVIGSSIKTEYQVIDGVPSIVRLPEIGFIDDKAGKPVGIESHIGRRPTIAVGNSDGDFEMLEWSTAGDGPRLGILIHHDDAEREYAYDRDSHIGKLERGLDEADARGWQIVSMRDDWIKMFPAE